MTRPLPRFGPLRAALRCGAIAALALLGLSALPAARATDASAAIPTDPAVIDAQVSSLLAQMTLEEKIGQLVQVSSLSNATGPIERTNLEEQVASGQCGSMLNIIGAADTRKWQEIALSHSRLKIPLLFGYDVIHGYRTIFPMNLGQAASWDIPAIEQSERIAATEASAAGIQWAFAPMVDIARDPRWGRIAEGSGEDTFLGCAIAAARVRGFQGGGLDRTDTVMACVKHFAAYGAVQAGRDYNTTDVPEITLRQVYLPPFKAAIDAVAQTVMVAFNDLNGVPCSANSFLLDQVLRREWGFKGFVVSDWKSISQLIPHTIAADGRQACLLAYNAGVDMDMEGRIYQTYLAGLIRSGKVSSAHLDRAVSAILRAKVERGLFVDPYRFSDPAREKAAMLRPSSLEAARVLAEESCVLLKNDAGALPLARTAHVALVGPLADSARDLLGSWAGQGRASDAVTLRTALTKTLGADHVAYAEGCSFKPGDRSGFDAAVAAARKSDVVVAVLGEPWYFSGEGNCRTHLDLPGEQPALLRALRATGKPVVVVLMNGRPLVLGDTLANCDALLEAWYPGTQGGPALAKLLTGAVSPSGKLPVTFPRDVGQIPIFYNHMTTGRPQPDDQPRIQYKSNYLDVPNTPQFPFGYGLSYTSFAFSNARLSSPTLPMNGALTVTATLANTGSRDGAEVAQLYIRQLWGSVTRPVRELKGFRRVMLRKGESTALSFTLRPSDLAFVHSDMTNAPEPGRFEVFLGGDSKAPKIGEFTLLPR